MRHWRSRHFDNNKRIIRRVKITRRQVRSHKTIGSYYYSSSLHSQGKLLFLATGGVAFGSSSTVRCRNDFLSLETRAHPTIVTNNSKTKRPIINSKHSYYYYTHTPTLKRPFWSK